MWLYEFLLMFAFLFYLPKALWRRRLPHRGWQMRWGRYPASVRQSLKGRPVIWLHAVSVGEVLAARPLLEGLAATRPTDALVVSTVTPGGFQLASTQRAASGAVIYFPLDLRACVTRSLETIRPRALLLMESELWPVMIRLAKARGTAVAVVNGRISPRAFRRHRWVKRWFQGILHDVDLFLMQSQLDADRLLQLGAPPAKIRVVGSLKWDASLGGRPTPDVLQAAAQRLGLNGRQSVLVAGSTHRGEEQLILQAFQTLRSRHAHLRLIIAPRHLERLSEVEQLVQDAGWTSVRLSAAPADGTWEIGIVDTFGQLSTYYGLAAAVFVGGSLIPHGGQNPLEPASLGKPVIFGSSMHNFAEIAQQLLDRRAARQLTSAAELPAVLGELLSDRSSADAMGFRAQEIVEQSRGTTQRTLEALRPLLG